MKKDGAMELVCEAPAKINLYLAIKGKRADGFHDLETRMLKITLADRLRLAGRDSGITVACPGSELATGEGNLVHRAAQRFFAALGRGGGVHIVLEKKIPVAAGLGGGSSDAAAVLRGLNIIHGFPFSSGQLAELARPLGADVPFFVHDCTAAWATGIGDEIQAEDIPFLGWIVLVNPGFAVSTKWVYENFTLTTGGNPNDACAGPGNLPLYNDLEAVTIGKYPELGRIKDELLAAGAHGALMSGSGPTVFGLFESEAQARKSVARFAQRFGRNVFLARPLSTQEKL
ncbi:MAG: 4-(cytidine 5'-diphospho)-2-C-methyl-D-erythritol kinase [Deltaproteobacteria bacterium HGW-Deltaproteobacteria-3]|nr:MAG: 4-(cytidine 5'-diphospho)-2-C-methyl-D-erythritol kinase [Deltaproteobacteria bacterium HGW-Deltaproteobacteria-3]